MPPKAKKNQAAEKPKVGEEERDEPLQAVVGAQRGLLEDPVAD